MHHPSSTSRTKTLLPMIIMIAMTLVQKAVLASEDIPDSSISSSLRGGKHENDGRNLGFWKAIGDLFTGCPPGNRGDTCSAGCKCKGANTCEAYHHVCRAPGKENDSCHLTRPCGNGLTCEAGSHKCRAPGKENDSCHLTRPCGNGLTCEAGSHKCRAPGKHGDFCHLTRPCGNKYWCVDAISAWNHQICLPECASFDSDMKQKLKGDGYSGSSPYFGQKWDNGVVPFVADCELENNELALFSEAMKELEDKTGVQFVRYNAEEHDNYIVLTDIDSYSANSYVGKMAKPGWQRVNLDTRWANLDFNVGTAVHELVHALGWHHTQNRPDRDDYVTINWDNIMEDNKHNFEQEEVDNEVFQKVQKCRPYNYDSIMHYGKDAFSKSDSTTIKTKDSSKQDVIGKNELTAQDIDEIKTYHFGGNICDYSFVPKIRGRDDDSLSRFPNLYSAGGILRLLDYGGTVTFALSGSITAAQSGLDVFGCSMVAMITAVGGGTIRDAVFLARRPFWTSETEYIWMTVLTGFVTFFTWPLVMEWNEERRRSKIIIYEDENENENADSDSDSDCDSDSDSDADRIDIDIDNALKEETNSTEDVSHYDEFDAAMDTFDAIGLSAFAIIGAQNGVRAGMPMIVSAICGMATSTFGGVTRDVLCGRPVRIVHSNAEIYAQPALAGAVTYLLIAANAKGMFVSPSLRIGSAMFVCLGSRFMAVKHDVKLHTWETDEDNDGLGVAVRK